MVDNDPILLNSETLEKEIAWISEVIDTRLKLYFGHECTYGDIYEITPPEPAHRDSMYASLVKHYNLSFHERAVLMLGLIPHIRPQLLDVFFVKNGNVDRGFTEFGGVKGNGHGGFLPTGETALFLLAGENLEQRFALQYLFDGDHFFSMHAILRLEPSQGFDPFLSGVINVSREIIDFVTLGHARRPNFDRDFPARRITTPMDWEDLVLEEQTFVHLDEIKAWIEFEHTIMNEWNMRKKLKPGYRALFYGPPGTGKTLTASLLGKATDREVYRIDLSMVVSKYIGETEKNLSKIFEQAEHKKWLLFFDEADALFGKRTKVEDAHDRYANQEVSYLLQRIEDFEGIVILASNFKSNLDEAFTRRFQSVIHFPMPRPSERLLLWQKAFSDRTVLEPAIRLDEISMQYEISGGAMMNVVRYCSLMALRRGGNTILLSDLEEGIRREYRKEGRTV
ncbi:MAG TPA: ATP-binding protein [Bacteroidia bacterium]|nr:ATP-binding protein [Bacteroidia bacterium]